MPCVRSVFASIRSLRPVAYLPRHRSSVRSRFQRPVQRPVQRSVASASSFLRDLAYGLVPIFMLGLCLISWVFSCASKVLLEVLIIGSSRRLRQVMSCTLLNYKTNTCKFISPIWLCWSSNTKIQSKWAKGPFSLQT